MYELPDRVQNQWYCEIHRRSGTHGLTYRSAGEILLKGCPVDYW